MTSLYAEPSQVDDFAQENGHNYWGPLELSVKLQICNEATNDIEVFHDIPRVYGVPFKLGNVDLLDIAIDQALFIARTFHERRQTEKVNSSTGDSYNVGSFEFKRMGERQWSQIALTRLKQFNRQFGIFNTGRFLRG